MIQVVSLGTTSLIFEQHKTSQYKNETSTENWRFFFNPNFIYSSGIIIFYVYLLQNNFGLYLEVSFEEKKT